MKRVITVVNKNELKHKINTSMLMTTVSYRLLNNNYENIDIQTSCFFIN